VHLSQIDAVAEAAGSTSGDVLGILAILSSSEAGYLQMELRSVTDGHAEVSLHEFMAKLRAWRKDRSIPREEWERWAGGIRVRWLVGRKGADE
jgi:hypothetical protein